MLDNMSHRPFLNGLAWVEVSRATVTMLMCAGLCSVCNGLGVARDRYDAHMCWAVLGLHGLGVARDRHDAHMCWAVPCLIT